MIDDALTLQQWLWQSCWVRSVHRDDAIWWPVSYMQRPEHVGVVVVERTRDNVLIRLVDPETPCAPVPDVWSTMDAASEVGGAVIRATVLGVGMSLGLPLTIVYKKGDDAEPQQRRISRIVPSPNGAGILCADLDKDAPRQFNLARIVGVQF